MSANAFPPPTVTLDQVVIHSARMEALANFYQDALDLKEWSTSFGWMSVSIGGIQLTIMQEEHPEPGNRVTLWFRVNDIQSAFERLCLAGARVHYPPTYLKEGRWVAELEDIDSNRIGLTQSELR